MLPHVFLPRGQINVSKITIGGSRDPWKSPNATEVAALDLSVFAHGFEELGFTVRRHIVLDSNQYRAIGIGFNRAGVGAGGSGIESTLRPGRQH
jgi:hypothetical protein